MSREENIEADKAKAERKQEEALKAGDRALAGKIQKRLLVIQEDLKNERQRLNYERDLELAKARHQGYSVFIPYITTAGKGVALIVVVYVWILLFYVRFELWPWHRTGAVGRRSPRPGNCDRWWWLLCCEASSTSDQQVLQFPLDDF